MNKFDLTNGLFEAVGSLFVWANFFRLLRDREIKGVLWHVTAFYTVWSAWNLFYYPALNQWFSAAAGGVLCAGNLAWVVLALRVQSSRVPSCEKKASVHILTKREKTS